MSREFLEAIGTLVTTSVSKQKARQAVESIATILTKLHSGDEIVKGDADERADKTVRILPSYLPIGNPTAITHRYVTYLFNRLTVSLGSEIPGVRECVGTAYVVLVNYLLRVGVLSRAALPTLFQCLLKTLHNEDERCKEEVRRANRVGLLAGIRFIYETGYFGTPEGAKDLSVAIGLCHDLIESRGFALIGGDLAADLAARFIALMMAKDTSPTIQKLVTKDKNTSKLVEALVSAHKDATGFTKSNNPGQNEIDTATTLVPKIVMLMKLKQLWDNKLSVPKGVASVFTKFNANFGQTIRSLVNVGLVASSRKAVPLASYWSMLFVTAMAIDNSDEGVKGSAVKAYLKAVEDCCFKSQIWTDEDEKKEDKKSSISMRTACIGVSIILSILTWSKTMTVCTVSPLWHVSAAEIFSYVLSSGDLPGFFKFVGTSLNKKNSSSYDICHLFQTQIGALLNGTGLPYKKMYDLVLYGAKKKRLTHHQKGMMDFVVDPTPYGFFGIIECRPFDTPGIDIHTLYDAVFLTELKGLGSETRAKCWMAALSHLEADFGSSALYQSMNLALAPRNLTPEDIVGLLKLGKKMSAQSFLRLLGSSLSKDNGVQLNALVMYLWMLLALLKPGLKNPIVPGVKLPTSWTAVPNNKQLLAVLNGVIGRLKRFVTNAYGVRHEASGPLKQTLEQLADLLKEALGAEAQNVNEEVSPLLEGVMACLQLPALLFKLGVACFVPSAVDAEPIRTAQADLAKLTDLAQVAPDQLIQTLLSLDLEKPIIVGPVEVEDQVKFINQFNCARILGQQIALLLAERAAAELVDHEQVTFLWSVVVPEVDQVGGGGDKADESGGGDESEAEESVDVSEPSTVAEETPEVAAETTAATVEIEGKDEEEEEEDEILDPANVDIFQFLTKVDENEEYQKVMMEEAKKGAAALDDHDLPRRIRAAKLLEGKLQSLSRHTESVGPEDIGILQTSVVNACILWPELVYDAPLSETWARIAKLLLQTLGSTLLTVAQHIEINDTTDELRSNALVCYSQLAEVVMEMMKRYRGVTQEYFNILMTLAAGLSGINEKLLENHPPSTLHQVVKVIVGDDEPGNILETLGWALASTYKQGACSFHPSGIRCHRCSKRQRGHTQVHCYTLPHFEAIIVSVYNHFGSQSKVNDTVSANLARLLRAVHQVQPDKAKSMPVLLAVGGVEAKYLARELVAVLHELR
eukprot:Blabericola_migrator_1__8070@NODE_414_length_8710_cov_194_115238_g326_i0_p1_GENE_NODE_414_length_8710_cov_194_115238_g326_i0NODE_414_length_8710_cov_194_115238_g326_i0_p1_ORF_typecomplete_len1203_score282_01T2SSF/PF00482_23/0_01T2SSF/PF00482_23/1_4e04DNA_pol_phi/PF04931_13/8_2DNA_pol_phi/PF04931_13/57SDA1/PF05285_12/6_5_NODE_414_length_8710_cov_194_115238_g326_i013064914